MAASIAKMPAFMKASFSLTSSNSPIGWPNWIRVAACLAARSAQNFAAPVQVAPNVVRPKSSTVRATFSPLPSCPSTFSRGTNMSRNASRLVAVPRTPHFGIRASVTSKPGMSGVTMNAVIFVSVEPGTGVRAITVSTCARLPLVIQRFSPLST